MDVAEWQMLEHKNINDDQKKYHHVQNTQFSLTSTAAMPRPEPMHMLVTKIRLFVCLAMFKPVAICRAPAIQKGNEVSSIQNQTLGKKNLLIPRG
jgi:hypothetical protein